MGHSVQKLEQKGLDREKRHLQNTSTQEKTNSKSISKSKKQELGEFLAHYLHKEKTCVRVNVLVPKTECRRCYNMKDQDAFNILPAIHPAFTGFRWNLKGDQERSRGEFGFIKKKDKIRINNKPKVYLKNSFFGGNAS